MHRQLKSSLGKNLILYSLIRVWLVIALNTLAYRELKWPKNFSYEPPLVYEDSIGLSSLSTRLRKCFPLKSKAWNIIFQVLIISLYSDFLLKSHYCLHGRSRIRLNNLVFLLTALWRYHLLWLRNSQNSIVFFWLHVKKLQSSLRTKLEWDW